MCMYTSSSCLSLPNFICKILLGDRENRLRDYDTIYNLASLQCFVLIKSRKTHSFNILIFNFCTILFASTPLNEVEVYEFPMNLDDIIRPRFQRSSLMRLPSQVCW